MRKITAQIGCFLFLGLLASGCDAPRAEDLSGRFQRAWDALMGRVPEKAPSGKPQSEAERKLQENSKLLREIFEVVWLREPYGPEEFGSYVNSLSQGGTLEGIYNGFVNSSVYRKIEETSPPAEPATVQVFAEQVSLLQKELTRSTRVRPSDLGVSAPFDAQAYAQAFAHASLPKMKRLLGNEAMKVLEAKRGPGEKREELASWYSSWVTELARKGVDFGLPLRNRADPEFHREWVKSLRADVYQDRVFWEVMNRVHRLLNDTEANAIRNKEKK